METWAVLWRGFLILGVGALAAVSVWVTIAGVFDIRQMVEDLRRGEGEDSAD